MRIAQVAPLFESVPPRYYGGTERVVSHLTEELVRQGHDVTLFASGDSVTLARLIAMRDQSLRLDPRCVDPVAHHVLMLEQVQSLASEFDIVHFHVDYLHFPLARRLLTRHLTTLHGRLDIPDLVPLYREFSEIPLASISDAQRQALPFANWLGTVHHGIPEDLFSVQPAPGGYLAFLGRVSPEKGLDRAIEIAHRTGVPLKVAAKVDRADREYYEKVLRPLLDDPIVEYLGEIGERDKDNFLGNALALLFPVDWPEPFGLVMIEAMACGTPVVAFPRGAVPEVVDEGVTGFIVDDVGQAAAVVERLRSFDRLRCRRAFEQRFSARRMARDYVALYERLVGGRAASVAYPQSAGALV